MVHLCCYYIYKSTNDGSWWKCCFLKFSLKFISSDVSRHAVSYARSHPLPVPAIVYMYPRSSSLTHVISTVLDQTVRSPGMVAGNFVFNMLITTRRTSASQAKFLTILLVVMRPRRSWHLPFFTQLLSEMAGPAPRRTCWSGWVDKRDVSGSGAMSFADFEEPHYKEKKNNGW